MIDHQGRTLFVGWLPKEERKIRLHHQRSESAMFTNLSNHGLITERSASYEHLELYQDHEASVELRIETTVQLVRVQLEEKLQPAADENGCIGREHRQQQLAVPVRPLWAFR